MEETTNTTIYRGLFDIMQNPAGDILIIIDAFESEPDRPRFVVDKNRKLFFYREPVMCLEFMQLDTKVVEAIARVEEVLVAEIEGEETERQYTVPVRLVNGSFDDHQ